MGRPVPAYPVGSVRDHTGNSRSKPCGTDRRSRSADQRQTESAASETFVVGSELAADVEEVVLDLMLRVDGHPSQ